MPRGDGTGPAGGDGPGTGRGAGRGFNSGRGGRNSGGAYGPGGDCICVACNIHVPHQPGVSCTSLKCPKCGRTLIREELYNDRKKS